MSLRALLPALLLSACASRQERLAEEFLRTEASFIVPYVDLDAEEKAVRRVFAQRKLVVDDVVRGQGFAALSASSLDQKRSAVRILTQRGVVAAEDGDLEDLFAPRAVRLVSVAVRVPAPETLLGVHTSARAGATGCVQLYRVLPDGRLSRVQAELDRFGAFACLSSLGSEESGVFRGRVAWPELSAGVTPSLRVDLQPVTPRLDRPKPKALILRVRDAGAWLDDAAAELAAAASAGAPFEERQARGVAAAALALLRGESAAAQVAAYRQGLGGVMPGTGEADVMARTVDHIEHGWSEEVASDDAPSTAEEAPNGEAIPEDAEVIEPQSP